MNMYDPSEYWELKLNYLWPRYEVKNRSRLKLKTACTTIMSIKLTNITHWDVSAVVLVVMLFTKWYLLEYWTILWPRYKVKIRLRLNSMHNYNATLVNWQHTLGCQCSSFGSSAVHKVEPVKKPKRYWWMNGQTGGQTEIIILIVGLVTCNPPKNNVNCHQFFFNI